MKGTEKILENIINYVSNNNVILTDGSEREIDLSGSEYSPMSKLSSNLVWKEVSDYLKIDNISKYLLENFQDSIEKEDYISASYMKKEISKRLSLNVSELDSIGVDLLVELKNGCSNSEFFNYLTNDVNDLLVNWGNTEYVLNGIKELREDLNRRNTTEVKSEIMDTIFDFDKNESHPTLMVEKIELFLNITL